MAVAAPVLLRPTTVGAGACGDDVDGVRVACACGDLVVSNTILSATDPIVSQPCAGDGLAVAAPHGGAGLILDLAGLSLVGTGEGIGLRVVRGGEGGAVIVGGDGGTRATIARFRTGIAASGSTVVKELRDVDLIANVEDGMHIRTSGMLAESVTAQRNGADGMRVSGHGSSLIDVEASENLGSGLRVGGTGATIRARSTANRANGAVVTGRGHDLTNSELSDNGAAGVMASGRGHAVSGVRVEGNERGGVAGRRGAVQ
ncbi:MAG: hypothetical protein HY899_12345 [Deltaproteobacteria bacterium]|nr:hypothetical protein [Deltaproteobacteria bacterium]